MTTLNSIIRLIRPVEWVKNVVVLAPLVFSQNLTNETAVLNGLCAAALFCLVASSVYIFNDICDRKADANHQTKKNRPIASGQISVGVAVSILVVLVAAALALLFFLPVFSRDFQLLVASYVVINIVYSAWAKKIPVVEIFMVASGFIIRLLAGGEAIDIPISNWMLVCTASVSLLLVTCKRRAEIVSYVDGEKNRESLRTYSLPYLDQVITLLCGTAMVSYLMFCVSDYGLIKFGKPVLFTAVLVALGLMRYLQIVMVDKKGESPTTLIVRDPSLAGIATCWLAVFLLILY